jgi:hypothetical protein
LGGRPITSRAGAMGLMQIMPGTWAELRARLGLGADPHDPRDNILAGAFYLKLMYDRFGYPGLFGAYNAGPARYAAWLADRRPLPAETRAYLAQLGGAPGPAASPQPSPARATLFALDTPAGGSRTPIGAGREDCAFPQTGRARLGKAQHDGRRSGCARPAAPPILPREGARFARAFVGVRRDKIGSSAAAHAALRLRLRGPDSRSAARPRTYVLSREDDSFGGSS